MKKISDGVFSLILTCLISLLLFYYFGLVIIDLVFIFGFLSCAIYLVDLVKALKGNVEYFDPAVILSIMAAFITFISPVSQIYWDYWPFLPSMSDEKEWIYLWSLLNLLGAIIYRLTLDSYGSCLGIKKEYSFYIFSHARFIHLSFLFIMFSAVCQAYIYLKFGGVTGFLETFSTRQEEGAANYDPFEGLGLLMLFAESFKYIFATLLIYLVSRTNRFRSTRGFLFLMLILASTFIVFGGLRGSRSATLFPLIFSAGMYHYLVRKLDGKIFIFGFAATITFSVGYYWYKVAGVEGVQAIFDESVRTDFHEDRQNSTQYLIVRDLGRMDLQSLALMKIATDEIEKSYGRTYVVSIFSSVPKTIIPYKPDQITKEKTEIIHGVGSYNPDAFRQTTLVLGQFGEALVNFGILGGLLFFYLLGRLTAYLRNLRNSLECGDVRFFILPCLNFVPLLMFITDMNVVLYQLTRYLTLPIILVLLSSLRYRKGC